MDLLDDILRALGLRATVNCSRELSGSWRLEHDGQRAAAFHMLANGACLLELPGRRDAVELRERDLLVLPRNSPHVLESMRTTDLAGRRAMDATMLICGHFLFGHPKSNFLLDELPDYLLIRAGDLASVPVLPVVQLIIEETLDKKLASVFIVDRLADVLFATVVRCQAEARSADTGLLAALADRQVAKAMSIMHGQPAKEWQIGDLAHQAGLSPSALIGRFNEKLGLTPTDYLREWRMLKTYELREPQV